MNEGEKSILGNSDFLEENRSADYRPIESQEDFNSISSALKEINKIAGECANDEKALEKIARIIEEVKNENITPEEGLKRARMAENGVKK